MAMFSLFQGYCPQNKDEPQWAKPVWNNFFSNNCLAVKCMQMGASATKLSLKCISCRRVPVHLPTPGWVIAAGRGGGDGGW